MLFIYLGHFLVFSYSLITYACSIIAVYRHRATLLNLIYLVFCTLINTSFVYLAKFAVHWQIHFIIIIMMRPSLPFHTCLFIDIFNHITYLLI